MKNFLLIVLCLPVFANAQIQKQSSFESAITCNYVGSTSCSYSPFYLLEGSASYSLQISNEQARSGSNSFRTEIRKTDGSVPFGSYRSELTIIPKGTIAQDGYNTYRISYYIPTTASAWLADPLASIFPCQWHPWSGTSTNGSPSMSFLIKGGNMIREIRHTNGNTSLSAPEVILTKSLGPVITGKWVDLEIYYDARPDASGRVIINQIVDGVRTVIDNYTGPCLHAWSEKPFWKVGMYWWNKNSSSYSTTRIAYIDMAAYGRATAATFQNVISLAPPSPTIPEAPSVTPNPPYVLVRTGTTTPIAATASAVGGIKTILWSQLSGPNTATITNGSTLTATASGLVNGTYTFNVAVTDNYNQTTNALVTVYVNNPPVVQLDTTMSFSFAKTITSITASGSATDADGTVTGYKWSQVDGPTTLTFTTDNDTVTTITGMTPGTYTVRLTATDNDGATSSDDYSFVVQAGYLITRKYTKKVLLKN